MNFQDFVRIVQGIHPYGEYIPKDRKITISCVLWPIIMGQGQIRRERAEWIFQI